MCPNNTSCNQVVPVRGGPNAKLALLAGVALGEVHQADVTALHIYGSEHHPKRRAAEVDLVHNLLSALHQPHRMPLDLPSSRT